MKLLPLSAALILALAACNQSANTTAPADPAPAATVETASPATVAQAAPATDAAADFELTMDKVDAFFAAAKNLAAVEQADASLDSAMNASETAAQFAARLEASPKMRAAIEAADMSVEDYALTNESLVAALMAVGAKEAGMLDEIPAEIPTQHIEFVKANKAELEKRMTGQG